METIYEKKKNETKAAKIMQSGRMVTKHGTEILNGSLSESIIEKKQSTDRRKKHIKV